MKKLRYFLNLITLFFSITITSVCIVKYNYISKDNALTAFIFTNCIIITVIATVLNILRETEEV